MALRLFSNPINHSLSIFDDFDRLFTSLESKHHSSSSSSSSSTISLRMPIDIKETSDSFNIIADLPGLTKQDVKISIQEDNILVIEAERKQEENKIEGDNYYRVERSSGHVSRSFVLPDNVDPEKVSASFENGVLKLIINKKTPDQMKEKVKTIEIN